MTDLQLVFGLLRAGGLTETAAGVQIGGNR